MTLQSNAQDDVTEKNGKTEKNGPAGDVRIQRAFAIKLSRYYLYAAGCPDINPKP